MVLVSLCCVCNIIWQAKEKYRNMKVPQNSPDAATICF